MPVCEECDGDDWDEIDGHFYCTTCQTQSQHFRVEEEEDVVPSHSYQLMITKKKSATAVAHTKKEKDKGRPWHTYEAFQFVIKEQVKVLISYGADPKLKDIVFKYWCNYLSKTGIAFPENVEKQQTLFRNYQRHREKYPATLDDPIIQPVRIRKTLRKKYGPSAEETDAAMVKRHLASTLEDEDFYEGDNPTQEDADSDEGDTYSVDEDYNNVCLSSLRQKTEWMTLLKTLGFCYLGLLFLNSLVTASDIVRWVQENRIPYLRASTLLPEDMKFSVYDASIYSSAKVPNVKDVCIVTGKLASFLGLPEPPVLTTSVLISKFVLRLNLPAEFHGFAQQVWSYIEKKGKNAITPPSKLPNYEPEAMAYIITALHLLFILDDHTEREISQWAKELSEILHHDYILFNWEDWVSHMSKKFVSSKILEDDISEFDLGYVKDTDRYLEDLQRRSKGTRRIPRELCKQRFNRSENPATVAAVQRLMSKLQSPLEDCGNRQESESNSTDPHFDDDPIGYLLGERNPDDEEKSRGSKTSFWNHSLKYLTETHGFIEEFSGCRSSECNVTHLENSDDSDDKDDLANDSEDLFNTTDDETNPKPKRRKVDAKKGASTILNFEKSKVKCSDKTKVMEITSALSGVKNQFKPVQRTGDLAMESFSFKWLLMLCSSTIKASPDVLYKMVKQLQQILFKTDTASVKD